MSAAQTPDAHSQDDGRTAVEQLMSVVYDELRVLARQHLANERPDHTLQTTALAHEAFLRLIDQRQVRRTDEPQFLSLASHAIRRILVDHARARARIKRGGGAHRVPLDEHEPAVAAFDVLVVTDLLDHLAQIDAVQAKIVELKVFGGLTFAQIAQTLAISTGKAHGEWRMARAWLLDQLEQTS